MFDRMPRAGGYSRIWMTALAFCAPVPTLAQQPFAAVSAPPATAQPVAAAAAPSPSILYRVDADNQKLEMIVNSSRMLTLDQNVPRVQVNNKDVLDVTPLSPTQIQIFAKKAGVTQVNLWTADNRIHTVDVVVKGDARELSLIISKAFPNSKVNVQPMGADVMLSGFVDRADHAAQITQIAQEFYPKVLNHVTVGGVQQVAIKFRVMEVSRSKLRAMGTDFATSSGSQFLVSGVSGLIDPASAVTGVAAATGDTLRGGFVDGNTKFFAFIEFLQTNQLVKVLAEPTVTTSSGRPSYFLAGGQIPILVPGGLGTVSIEYKDYGTRVDVVPFILGNGNIRLEVRPTVSELDSTHSVTISGTTVPALVTRSVDAGVEMKPGQTLALAGLVQRRVDTSKTGVPYLMDWPYIGAAFRRTSEQTNEVELLITVTPQIVSAMDPSEVPPCGPGLSADLVNDHDFFASGMIERPACGPCGDAVRGCNAGCSPQIYAAPAGGPVPAPRPATLEALPSVQPTPPNDPGANNNSASLRRAPASVSTTTAAPVANGNFGATDANRANPAAGYNAARPQTQRDNMANYPKGGTPGLIGPVGYDVGK